jgi:hypothetical protein
MFQGLVLDLHEEVVACVGVEVEVWGTGSHEAEEDRLGELFCCLFLTGYECS